MKNNIKRRSFFRNIGITGLGLLIVSKFPANLFSKLKPAEKIRVKIHPDAVKRN